MISAHYNRASVLPLMCLPCANYYDQCVMRTIGMRTISRCHAVLFLLSQCDAAIVAGVAAALAADVGR